MSLIKCPECEHEISNTVEKCIHCGYTLKKEELVQSEDTQIVVKNQTSNQKNLIFILIVIFGAIIIFLVTDKDKSVVTNGYIETYNKLNDIIESTEILATDLYSSWHYGIYEDDPSLDDFASNLSLSTDELTDYYCSLMLYMDDFNYYNYCLENRHEALGNYEAVEKNLDEVKNMITAIKNSKHDEEILELIEEYYQSTVNFYELAHDYNGSFNQYSEDIKDLRNEIKKLKTKLDLELN